MTRFPVSGPAVRTASRSVASAALSVVLALIVGAVLIVLTDEAARTSLASLFLAPGPAISDTWSAVWNAYSVLVSGSIGSVGALSETLTRAAPLVLMGLSVSLAFRAGLFNMGGQGQFLAGTLGSVWVAFTLPDVPAPILLVLASAAGAVCGGVVGFVPGFLKARSGAHEVIVTLMLNAMLVYFMSWILTTSAFQRPGQTAPLSRATPVHLPHLLGDGYRVNVSIVVAVLAAVGTWWVLMRTNIGFAVRTVGANRTAAHYAGLSLGRTFMGVMFAAGALSGLAGAVEVLGVQMAVFPGIDGSYLLGGIAVALLARTQPIGVVFAALLFGAMQAGGVAMQARTGVSADIVGVVQALVIFFVAAPLLVQRILRTRSEVGSPQQLSKGWGG